MATLKSIKNKYLTASDGTALGVTTNTENVSLLAFKLATADSLSKFNLVDGFSDDYQDATGVDTSASTGENRNALNYYSGSVVGAATYTVFNTTPGGGTWTVPAGVTSVEALVVAGGGAGGHMYGGGGGAGGIVHHTTFAVTPAADVTVTVGAGGTGANSNAQSASGGDSVFSTMTAKGGGGGGNSQLAGHDGGSGGGGGMIDGSDGTGGSATQADSGGGTGYGNDGGDGEGAPDYTGGGGGGAAAAGSNSAGNNAGPGGAGKLFSNFTSYGESSGYFGGGGGGTYNNAYANNAGDGGTGGGGNGREISAGTSYSGTANTGGGGGAGGNNVSTYSGAGGSGFVGLLYTPLTYDNMTLASNAYTSQADPATIRIMVDEYTSTGSATINTDIKAYASRDNGTTYTLITLADQGTIETNHRYLSGSVDVSGQPAGSNVKYKIETLNQSASKVTRIYGTSMAWA